MSNSTNASLRINSLLDENSFVEIGARVTARATDFNMKPNETPSDGCITGYGVIDRNPVYVYSQDASVLNGTIGEMHAKKITGLYELAMKTGAPVIGLIDCAGMRIQEASDALNAFGSIYMKQTLASGMIPQIIAVLGTCGGGMGLFPALCDFTFMAEKNAKLFVNSPDALDSNNVKKCDSSSAKFQAEECGSVDVVADEENIFSEIRRLVSLLPSNSAEGSKIVECTDDLNRNVSGIENCVEDSLAACAMIADNNDFYEIKASYAPEMVTGFARLDGVTVGIVANRSASTKEDGTVDKKLGTVLTVKGCEKAADFVSFCDSFEIPVLSLTNVTGYEANVNAEKSIAKAVAKLTYAFADATVPKVNLIMGKAFGTAAVAMNSKSIGCDLTIAWPEASFGVMEGSMASKIMYEGAGAEVINEKASEYDELNNNVNSAARRGYVDQIINPTDTRKYLIGAFEMLFNKSEDRPYKKHGTV